MSGESTANKTGIASYFTRALFLILMAGLSAAPSLALISTLDQEISSKEYDDCIESSEGIVDNLLDCDRERMERFDAILNDTYRALLQTLLPEQQQYLNSLERKWLARRERHCQSEAIYDPTNPPDPLQLFMYQSCTTESTKMRIGWLKRYPNATTRLYSPSSNSGTEGITNDRQTKPK